MWKWILLTIVLSIAPFVQAQDDETCPPLITEALLAVDQNCNGLELNSACYGFNLVSASFNQPVPDDFFTNPADRADLTQLSLLRTAPLDEPEQIWGVAVLNVQANVPNTLPGQAVTMLLMGDASLQNQVPADSARLPVQPVDVVITANARLNVRSGAGTQFNVLGTLQPGEVVQVDGFNAARDWVRIVFDDVPAWISADFVSGDPAALATLPVVDDTAAFSPMQAFYFTTGIGRPTCNSAPDALVIQSPEGMIVNLQINGAEVSIGSTVMLTSTPEDANVMSTNFADSPCWQTNLVVIDGSAGLNGGNMTIPTGHSATMNLCYDESGEPVTEPEWEDNGELLEEDLARLQFLEQIPQTILRYPVDVPTLEEIRNANRASAPVNRNTNPVDNVRPEVPNLPTGVDCAGFVGTSPTDGMRFGRQQFYWDAGPVETSFYRVVVNATDRGGQVIGDVGAPVTNLVLDMGMGAVSQFGRGLNFVWKVQAWGYDANNNAYVICETPPVYIQREYIAPDAYCQMAGGSYDYDTCYVAGGTLEIPD